MWYLVLAAVILAMVYAYSIRGDIKVAPKSGCNSCPHSKVHEKTD